MGSDLSEKISESEGEVEEKEIVIPSYSQLEELEKEKGKIFGFSGSDGLYKNKKYEEVLDIFKRIFDATKDYQKMEVHVLFKVKLGMMYAESLLSIATLFKLIEKPDTKFVVDRIENLVRPENEDEIRVISFQMVNLAIKVVNECENEFSTFFTKDESNEAKNILNVRQRNEAITFYAQRRFLLSRMFHRRSKLQENEEDKQKDIESALSHIPLWKKYLCGNYSWTHGEEDLFSLGGAGKMYFWYAQSLKKNNGKEIEEALYSYKIAVRSIPSFFMAVMQLGSLLYNNRRYEEAEKVFGNYIEENVRRFGEFMLADPVIYKFKGLCNQVLGNYTKAIQDFSIYLEHKKDDVQIKQQIEKLKDLKSGK